MIKQKKNQELRSSLRILLGAIFLLAMAPASLRAKDAPVPSNGKITVDASEAVSEEMTQEEAEALEKGLVEADKAGQLDRSLVEELSDGTEPEGTAKGIGWQYRKLAERSGESTLDIVVSRLDKIEGILDAIQAAQAAKDLGRAQELLDEESPLENVDQLSQTIHDRVQGPAGLTSCPGDSCPCPSAHVVHQQSRENQACAGGHTVSTSCPG